MLTPRVLHSHNVNKKQPTLMEYLLCTRPCSEHSSGISSLSPHNHSLGWLLLSLMRKLRRLICSRSQGECIWLKYIHSSLIQIPSPLSPHLHAVHAWFWAPWTLHGLWYFSTYHLPLCSVLIAFACLFQHSGLWIQDLAINMTLNICVKLMVWSLI